MCWKSSKFALIFVDLTLISLWHIWRDKSILHTIYCPKYPESWGEGGRGSWYCFEIKLPVVNIKSQTAALSSFWKFKFSLQCFLWRLINDLNLILVSYLSFPNSRFFSLSYRTQEYAMSFFYFLRVLLHICYTLVFLSLSSKVQSLGYKLPRLYRVSCPFWFLWMTHEFVENRIDYHQLLAKIKWAFPLIEQIFAFTL